MICATSLWLSASFAISATPIFREVNLTFAHTSIHNNKWKWQDLCEHLPKLAQIQPACLFFTTCYPSCIFRQAAPLLASSRCDLFPGFRLFHLSILRLTLAPLRLLMQR